VTKTAEIMVLTDLYNSNSTQPEPPFDLYFQRKDRTETYRGDGFHPAESCWSWGRGGRGGSASSCTLAGYLLYAM